MPVGAGAAAAAEVGATVTEAVAEAAVPAAGAAVEGATAAVAEGAAATGEAVTDVAAPLAEGAAVAISTEPVASAEVAEVLDAATPTQGLNALAGAEPVAPAKTNTPTMEDLAALESQMRANEAQLKRPDLTPTQKAALEKLHAEQQQRWDEMRSANPSTTEASTQTSDSTSTASDETAEDTPAQTGQEIPFEFKLNKLNAELNELSTHGTAEEAFAKQQELEAFVRTNQTEYLKMNATARGLSLKEQFKAAETAMKNLKARIQMLMETAGDAMELGNNQKSQKELEQYLEELRKAKKKNLLQTIAGIVASIFIGAGKDAATDLTNTATQQLSPQQQ